MDELSVRKVAIEGISHIAAPLHCIARSFAAGIAIAAGACITLPLRPASSVREGKRLHTGLVVVLIVSIAITNGGHGGRGRGCRVQNQPQSAHRPLRDPGLLGHTSSNNQRSTNQQLSGSIEASTTAAPREDELPAAHRVLIPDRGSPHAE